MVDSTEHPQIKIADFGLSKCFAANDPLATMCGSPQVRPQRAPRPCLHAALCHRPDVGRPKTLFERRCLCTGKPLQPDLAADPHGEPCVNPLVECRGNSCRCDVREP